VETNLCKSKCVIKPSIPLIRGLFSLGIVIGNWIFLLAYPALLLITLLLFFPPPPYDFELECFAPPFYAYPYLTFFPPFNYYLSISIFLFFPTIYPPTYASYIPYLCFLHTLPKASYITIPKASYITIPGPHQETERDYQLRGD